MLTKNHASVFLTMTSLLCTSCVHLPKDRSPRKVAVPQTAVVLSVTTATENIDPYERFNRNTYRLNNQLDKIIVKPTAHIYTKVTPYFIRQGITNFFNNLSQIVNVINDVLQGRGYWSLNDFWSFFINTTVGVGGLFDVAKKTGLQPHTNNFSLTLLSWGAQPSPFIVLPLLGPATLTDANGAIFDFYLSPWNYGFKKKIVRGGLLVLEATNSRATLLQNQSLISQLAVDDYSFKRNVFLQYQAKLMQINQHPPIDKHVNNDTDELYTGD